jgi:transcriptional regulator with XRE-family HTH domain
MKKIDFGTILFEARKAKGLTQEEIAEKAKITVRTIQRIESGLVHPRASTMKIISDVLGFDFFETFNYSLEARKENRSSNLKLSKKLRFVKDLINLKTNAMKKISILSASVLLIALVLTAFISGTNTQIENLNNKSILIQRNDDNSIKRIEVSFSNNLTLDSLVHIKNELDLLGITISYQKIEFDMDNQLLTIASKVSTNDGYSGGFAIGLLNSLNKDKKMGFYRDYSQNARSPFGTGSLKD